jgi:hypothetical protein
MASTYPFIKWEKRVKLLENGASYSPPFGAQWTSKCVEQYHHSLVCFYDVDKDWNFCNLLAYVLRYVTYVYLFCTMGFFEHNEQVLYKFHVKQK